jgi:uncharacterized protein YbjT (DUF2867 family)
MSDSLIVVTGAFGFSGKYITARLLAEGHHVRTLTNSPKRANPFGDRVEVHPYNFDNPDGLVDSLRGADVLYNTYWVRFNQSPAGQTYVVQNSAVLFKAAQQAGVRRIVHISITNPSEDSPLQYFSDKARVEKILRETSISSAILRPAMLFGKEGTLINNIVWALRRLPVFGLFGNGNYRVQPIYIDDLASLAVEQGKKTQNVTIDAIGPETFTFRELINSLVTLIGVRRLILPMPPRLAYGACWAIGRSMGDVMMTWPEVQMLMDNLLSTGSPPVGTTPLTGWVRQNKDTLGVEYINEIVRRKDLFKAY